MMKRLLSAALITLSLAGLLAGCGSKQTDAGSAGAGSAAPAAADTVSLSTENDTFHLNMLSSLIQTPDTGVVELLGEGDDETYGADGSLSTRVYLGTLFSQDVRFTVSYDQGDVTEIDLTFVSTDASLDQISAAVSDVLGKQPSDDGIWKTDTARVSLSDQDDAPTLHFSPYSPNQS